ncbi:MAG: M48 family metallopeptidase [Cohaesibacter sp.]|nr:M48 family metallopeptidase [Cohaesibacter sp.]
MQKVRIKKENAPVLSDRADALSVNHFKASYGLLFLLVGISGETHFYLGRRYQLKVFEQPSQPSNVLLKGGQIQVSLPYNDPISVRRRLNIWYKQRADDYFQVQMNRVIEKISWVNECPPVKLVRMKTQWGSCSPKGSVHLNPLLIKAPRECIEYVLVHALCHLLEPNHSQRFYSVLAQQLPDWKHTKAKLDGMSELLLAE